MCGPVAIPLATMIIGAGEAVAQNVAQSQASSANKKSATQAMYESWKELDIRAAQTQDAANMSIMAADKQSREREALSSVSAGQSGVAGASVDALLSTFSNDAAANRVNVQRNTQAQLDQIQEEKKGAQVQAQSRIDSEPPPSNFLTAMKIGAAGLDYYHQTHLTPSGG